MKPKSLVLTGILTLFIGQAAYAQSLIIKDVRNIELIGAANMLNQFATQAFGNWPNSKDAAAEVANEVKGNHFLHAHAAEMVVLPENGDARFKLTLKKLAKDQCLDFVRLGADNRDQFPKVEVNGKLVTASSTAACKKGSTVSLYHN